MLSSLYVAVLFSLLFSVPLKQNANNKLIP